MTANTVIDLMQTMEVGSNGERMVGSSKAFLKMLRQAAEVALDGEGRVLILGEPGTGREMLARLIHRVGARGAAPFVSFNAAAIPASLLEGVLVGSDRPSAAGRFSRGTLERTEDGTLFTEDVTAMMPSVQGLFLEALRGQPYRRLYGTSPHRFRGQAIFAEDQRVLSEHLAQGRLSSALNDWMTAGAVIPVPPLRKREGDVTVIAEYAVALFTRHERRATPLRLTDDAREFLISRDYPGNVRKLINLIEMGVALTPVGADCLELTSIAGTNATRPRE